MSLHTSAQSAAFVFHHLTFRIPPSAAPSIAARIGSSPQGSRQGRRLLAFAPGRRVGERRFGREAQGTRRARQSGRLSLVTFFGGTKKVTRARGGSPHQNQSARQRTLTVLLIQSPICALIDHTKPDTSMADVQCGLLPIWPARENRSYYGHRRDTEQLPE